MASQRAAAVHSQIWSVERLARFLSLDDLKNLSEASPARQSPVRSLYASPRVNRLLLALEESIPEVKDHMVEKGLEQGVDSAAIAVARRRLSIGLAFLHSWEAKPWGAAVAAISGLPEDLTQLLTVSKLPRGVIEYVVQHLSVRVHYQQLLAAARSREAGVEVWVEVQHELGIQTDIPEPALAVCCEDYEAIMDLLARAKSQPKTNDSAAESAVVKDYIDLMHIAVNCSNPYIAGLICRDGCMCQRAIRENAAVMQQLFETAILRWHCEVEEYALIPQVLPSCNLPAVAIYHLISTDIQARVGSKWRSSATCKMVRAAVNHPAAEALTVHDVRNLINTVLQHMHTARNVRCFEDITQSLVKLPAAALLTTDDVVCLLSKTLQLITVHSSNWYHTDEGIHVSLSSVEALCELPAAQHISVADYISLLQLADAPSIEVLRDLPAASRITVAEWTQVCRHFIWAPRHRNAEQLVQQLCSMPAAEEADSDDIYTLLLAAFKSDDGGYWTASLCDLSAAQGIFRQQVCELLQAAISNLKAANTAVDHACRLHMAKALGQLIVLQFISTSELMALLEDPSQPSSLEACWLLLLCAAEIESLLAGGREQPSQTYKELADRVSWHVDPVQLHSLSSPGAQHLYMFSMLESARTATWKPDLKLIQEKLCLLPDLSKDNLLDLMHGVLGINSALLPQVCELPAASELTPDDLARLLHAVLHSEFLEAQSHNIRLLCRLDAASGLDSTLWTELLSTAVDDSDVDLAAELCDTINANSQTVDIDTADLVEMLNTAVSSSNGSLVRVLCQLPAARSITGAQLKQILDAAVGRNDVVVVHSLVQLPGVDKITERSIVQLLDTARQNGCSSAILDRISKL